jgi:S-adenosylmethionine decarboxylase
MAHAADRIEHRSLNCFFMHGLHLLADLRDCACALRVLRDGAAMLTLARAACVRAELSVVGESLHTFAGGGYTLALLLAESHVTLHTWPELRSATMDVFVCNHTRDNGDRARAVTEQIMALFAPRDAQVSEVVRGERADTPLRVDSVVKSSASIAPKIRETAPQV